MIPTSFRKGVGSTPPAQIMTAIFGISIISLLANSITTLSRRISLIFDLSCTVIFLAASACSSRSRFFPLTRPKDSLRYESVTVVSGCSPGVHVPTTVSCDVCHTSTTTFTSTKKPNHALLTGTCRSCHGANYSGVESK